MRLLTKQKQTPDGFNRVKEVNTRVAEVSEAPEP